MKVGIIANPQARQNQRNPRTLKKLKTLSENLILTQNLEELDHTLQNFHKNNIDTIAICGGDGTISQTISRLIKIYPNLPQLILLGGGTANVISNNLGYQGSPTTIWQKHLNKNPAKQKTVPLLHCNNKYGFLYADGCSARFLELFYHKKGSVTQALLLVFKLLAAATIKTKTYTQIVYPEPLTLEYNDTKLNFESITTLCSTLPHLPLNIKFFPNAAEKIQLVSLNITAQETPKRVIGIILNPEKTFPGKIEIQADKFKLHKPGKKLFTIDGELYESEENLEIKLGPKITFLVY